MTKIIIILLVDVLFLFTSLYEFQMLQQSGYNNKHKFSKFLKKDYQNYASNYLLKYLFAGTLMLYFSMTKLLFALFIFIMVMLIISSYYIYNDHNDKLPLKYTKRMIRIIILDYLILLAVQLLFAGMYDAFFAGASLFIIALNGYILIFIVFILSPLEKIIFNHYRKKAIKKLDTMPNLHVIGITGSYGKTSTKMILNTILKTKYKGFYTPGSFNTPNGNIMTINNQDTIFNDYFISEMGARKRGEIKELCDLVHPTIGIITTIGKAHLDTFKTIENIQKTKFELFESIPLNGLAVLNIDDDLQILYDYEDKCKITWVGIDHPAQVTAKNIKVTNKGSKFDIVINGEKEKIKAETCLLGKNNIYNILSSVAVAYYLGVPLKMIEMGIHNIEPISHRLELKKMGNITILDDAYNSNPAGAKMACEVLAMMDKKKIAITPGMVEMGAEEDNLNFEFGKQLASSCDDVYLIGKKHTLPIYNGLIEGKFNKENIHVYNDFKEAYNDAIKSVGSQTATILIENDLPDSYKESK